MQPLSLLNLQLPSLGLSSRVSTSFLPAAPQQPVFDTTTAQRSVGQATASDLGQILQPLIALLQQIVGMSTPGGITDTVTPAPAPAAGAAGKPAPAPAPGAAGKPAPAPAPVPVAAGPTVTNVGGKIVVRAAGTPADRGPVPNQPTGNPFLSSTLPGGSQGVGVITNASLDQVRGLTYTQLTEAQRQDFNGVSRDSAGIIHLGGRALISGARSANGVSPMALMYNNVLTNASKFHPEEVAMIQAYAADEIQRRGMITGEDLDHAFIDEMGVRDGIPADVLQQYHVNVEQRVENMLANPNRAGVLADTRKTLNLVDDIGTLSQQSGLNANEQAAFRLAGHAVLFSGDGSVNGNILAVTAGNPNALDNNKANNGTIDPQIQALISADVADDNTINGSSLRTADQAVLEKLYNAGAGIGSSRQILDQSVATGLQSGRSMQDIQTSILNGGQQALADFKQLAADHSPAMLAMATTMAGASAICPFLGGMAAGVVGVAAAQQQAPSATNSDATAGITNANITTDPTLASGLI
jgi:hypothetical protein